MLCEVYGDKVDGVWIYYARETPDHRYFDLGCGITVYPNDYIYVGF